MRRACSVSILVFPLLACCLPTHAQTHTRPASASPLTLRSVMWQALPERIRDVRVGPDERVWYESRAASKGDKTSIQQEIQEVFSSPSPRLYYSEVALFEPEGRIWFAAMDRGMLIGYDGKSFIEYKPPPGTSVRFTGTCPGGGQKLNEQYNLYFDRCAFFPASQGVHVYNGAGWSYQHLSDENRPKIVLFASEQERQVSVLVNARYLWRWQKGEWSSTTIGPKDAYARIIWPGGQVLVDTSLGMSVVVLDDKPDARFNQLLDQMKQARNREMRQRISREMVLLGHVIKGAVEKAISSTYDQAVIEELVAVLEEVKKDARRLRLGEFLLDSPRTICMEPSGRTCLMAANAVKADRSLGFGVVIADSPERVRFVATERIDQSRMGQNGGPLLAPDASSV